MSPKRLPKKTKANGFWSFATSVRVQLQLYNPSEAAAYVTHSQELWELMSKDEQQEWKVFAREMEVRERLCPEYVVDIAADVQKQYDEDQKKLEPSSVGAVKDEPELPEEQNEVPPALTPDVVVKHEERVSTVHSDETNHEEWHTASDSNETVGSKQSPVPEIGLHVREMPHSGKEATPPAGSNIFAALKPAATVKEATGTTGLDGLFGEGGMSEFMRSPTRMTLMEAAAKWSQQKKLDSVPTTSAFAPVETAPSTAENVVHKVTESFVPATAVHDDSVRSYAQQSQPSPVFITDYKDQLEPELPRFESSIGADLSPDTGNAERLSRAEMTSLTKVRRSSSGSTLAKKRPTTLPPSLLIKKEAAAKAAIMQKQQPESQVASPVLMEPPSPAKVVKVMSISKSTSTLRASVSRTSTKEPSTPGSPTVSSENRSFGFGRGVSLRK